MTNCAYLLSYGRAGDFGPFQAEEPVLCRRGDRLVVRSPRGQEIGVVMRDASDMHLGSLAHKSVGQILRQVTPGDEELARRMTQRSQRLFDEGRQLAADLNLSMEIVDAEILLDGRQAVLHYVGWGDGDRRSLLDTLSERYRLVVTLHDLVLPTEEEPAEEIAGGCGSEGCGQGAGGCGSCSSGGCGTCSSQHKAMPTELPPLQPKRVPLV